MNIRNWINPRRARLQRSVVVAVVVIVGLLLTNAIYPLASTLEWSIAGGVWGFLGVLAANTFVEGTAL